MVCVQFIQTNPVPRVGRNNYSVNHQEQAELQERDPTGSYVRERHSVVRRFILIIITLD